ncbi:hypothetical protein BJ912DRAFT_961518 [Pholiota molesta]|nr:hypothetical protein BJ912DRAFT_961518 [Pholiota molesta]
MPASVGIDMDFTYDDLPPELVDHILRYACILSPSFCLVLSQTSSWARKLALPYLYSTMILKDVRTTKLVWENMVKRPIDDQALGYHVRSVWTKFVCEKFLDIFRRCDQLSKLALREQDFRFIIYLSSVQLPTSELYISEQTISCKPDIHLLIFSARNGSWSFPPPDAMLGLPVSPFYSKITHLRLGQMGPYEYRNLAHLTRLSHIAFPYHLPREQFLPNLLAGALHALKWVVDMRKKSHRVSAVLSKLDDLQMEWEEEARYGLSIWEKPIYSRNLFSCCGLLQLVN